MIIRLSQLMSTIGQPCWRLQTRFVRIDKAYIQLLPVKPPWAPVRAIRATASASVVHVTLVPGLLTSGRAAHVRPAAVLHGVSTNAPLTHWAKLPFTHATSPAEQEDVEESSANLALSSWASIPFCKAKEDEVEDEELEAVALLSGVDVGDDVDWTSVLLGTGDKEALLSSPVVLPSLLSLFEELCTKCQIENFPGQKEWLASQHQDQRRYPSVASHLRYLQKYVPGSSLED